MLFPYVLARFQRIDFPVPPAKTPVKTHIPELSDTLSCAKGY